jgi:hypothetical protein
MSRLVSSCHIETSSILTCPGLKLSRDIVWRQDPCFNLSRSQTKQRYCLKARSMICKRGKHSWGLVDFVPYAASTPPWTAGYLGEQGDLDGGGERAAGHPTAQQATLIRTRAKHQDFFKWCFIWMPKRSGNRLGGPFECRNFTSITFRE